VQLPLEKALRRALAARYPPPGTHAARCAGSGRPAEQEDTSGTLAARRFPPSLGVSVNDEDYAKDRLESELIPLMRAKREEIRQLMQLGEV